MERQLRDAVEAASRRAGVGEAVEAVYRALQVEIDERRPVCAASGRCCRFEEYGHRLYVTTIELATFVRELRNLPIHHDPGITTRKTQLPVFSSPSRDHAAGGCPFQSDRLCTAHAIRPFGCRVFFCDETATEWQHDAYERHHARLKRLHEELGVPYFYVEWRQALRALNLLVNDVTRNAERSSTD